MPEILVRHIDDALAERIKDLARARQWSINDVILHVLRHSLGLATDDEPRIDPRDIATLGGTWSSTENAAFREALSAFEHLDGEPLFEDQLSEAPPSEAPPTAESDG